VIKAAYLANFLRYIDWPQNTAPDAPPPTIGVIGPHPILVYLEQMSRQPNRQEFRVRQIASETLSDDCHILFIPGSLDADLQRKIIRAAKESPILTVGENLHFLEEGGDVRFVVQENRVRLEIAMRAVEAKHLKVSAKLLQIARVVDAEPRLSQGSR